MKGAWLLFALFTGACLTACPFLALWSGVVLVVWCDSYNANDLGSLIQRWRR